MKFTLYNNEGCEIKPVESTSFQKARKHFNYRYTGRYKIGWYDGKKCKYFSKNVILR
jgi:hypothetical protein